MNIILQIAIIVFILLILPYIIGILFHNAYNNYYFSLQYLNGFITMLCIFAIIFVPCYVMKISFSILSFIYSCSLFFLFLFSLFYIKRNNIKLCSRNKTLFSNWTIIYIILFIILLIYQIYMSVQSDMGGWSNDDAVYVVLSADTISNDFIYQSDPYSGSAIIGLDYKRLFQAFNWFPAYLTKISNIHVTIICHTILPVFLIILAYCAIYIFANNFISDIETKIIFMILMEVLYIWGSFSHYSITFRLLGPIWQGKAILAVIIFPYILSFYATWLYEKISFIRCIILCIISIAAMSLTLGGSITIVATTLILSFLTFIKHKSPACIIYAIVANFVPCACSISYILLSTY